MQEELDRVIGTDGLITMDDRLRLPYTNAVINETQRLSNLIVQNILHKTTGNPTDVDGAL
ncbi:Protein CYP-33C11 [Aphelenchoides avenae]|nr:Protein CYP-33C11 [Aphelenchus avenae]